jgi:hypothetical protein
VRVARARACACVCGGGGVCGRGCVHAWWLSAWVDAFAC